MILYHGSNIVVEQPHIMQSERMLDFGEGFYTTSNRSRHYGTKSTKTIQSDVVSH